MKYKKSLAIAKEGVKYVDRVVMRHGSIFRPVHGEDDVGIDGFIELVDTETASGRLVAVQIKSGESYVGSSANEFVINVGECHLKYWLEFMVPVILIAYSPSRDFAAWVSVRDYVEQVRYQERTPVTQIRIPFTRSFDVQALSKEIAALAHIRADERILLKAAEECLSNEAEHRRSGFQILANHPDSRKLKVTCLLARRLIMDPNIDAAKDALHVLGYGVGRQRWSSNPNNREEHEVIAFAGNLCTDLTAIEIRRLLELCDEEYFNGPRGLGERLFDVICCCFDTAQEVLGSVLRDPAQPIGRRANALYLLYECDDERIDEAHQGLSNDPEVRDVLQFMFGAPDGE